MTCLHIPIIDDRTVELIETFNVVLQRTEGLDARIILEDTIKEVAIIDDDGEYFICSYKSGGYIL